MPQSKSLSLKTVLIHLRVLLKKHLFTLGIERSLKLKGLFLLNRTQRVPRAFWRAPATNTKKGGARVQNRYRLWQKVRTGAQPAGHKGEVENAWSARLITARKRSRHRFGKRKQRPRRVIIARLNRGVNLAARRIKCHHDPVGNHLRLGSCSTTDSRKSCGVM